MDDQYASDIDRILEKGADRGFEESAFAESDRFAAEPEQYDDTDTPEHLARIYARAHAVEQEARVGHDAWLDREIKRTQDQPCGCNDGTHWDERGALEVMIELGTPDIDRARKVWHERTFSWDARSKARGETDPKIDKQSAYEKVSAMEDIAALKKKYTVKREPHRGRIEDDPRLDMILERALGPVRGNALPDD